MNKKEYISIVTHAMRFGNTNGLLEMNDIYHFQEISYIHKKMCAEIQDLIVYPNKQDVGKIRLLAQDIEEYCAKYGIVVKISKWEDRKDVMSIVSYATYSFNGADITRLINY